MRIELALCEQALLDDIGNKEMRRVDVAKTYALAQSAKQQSGQKKKG